MNSAWKIGAKGIDEQLLLADLLAHKPEAFTAFFNTYANPVFRLACGLLCDENAAEDVVQETFLKVLLHLDTFEQRATLGTWLYRVAYNSSISYLRRRQRLESTIEVAPLRNVDCESLPQPKIYEDWSHSVEEILLNSEACDKIDKSICNLPIALRAVFILRDVEGLSARQTADALEVSEMTIRRRLNHARLLLRESLTLYFQK